MVPLTLPVLGGSHNLRPLHMEYALGDWTSVKMTQLSLKISNVECAGWTDPL